MKKVLVFGTFDKIHPGHESLLHQARELGDQLIVAVARDEFVRKKKGRIPALNERQREQLVLKNESVDKAILCDEKIGEFESVRSTNPDIIALGYDQDELARKLRSWLKNNGLKIQMVKLKPYKPEKYKTSYARH